jgi:starch synthase (maltosyl-transferring)
MPTSRGKSQSGQASVGRPPPRVVIEAVEPEIDAGRFPAKRIVGDALELRASIFTEGHDRVAATLLHRRSGESEWSETPLQELVNDRFTGSFDVPEIGTYEYTLEAWVDRFATWREGLGRKVDAGVDVASELLEGAALVSAASQRAKGSDAAWLAERAERLRAPNASAVRIPLALDAALRAAMGRTPDRREATRYPRTLALHVECERAAVGAWYEFFPRSTAKEPGRHGTFEDAVSRLRHAASMGFDVVYLPPVHPVGRAHRKGRNNSPSCEPGEPGSPWAIGGPEGGHCAVHPELGTLADFDGFVAEASSLGIDVALDIAFQCSPDHPWVREHPGWFRHRPDGTIQYAENPPKKYQDVYPLDFECEDWHELWHAARDVFLFWAEHGITIFRVDNPHTKPFAFWEWVTAEVRARHPRSVFLSEAFTRPSVMKYLAKAGFSQSYTYFTWRNTKAELTRYLEELTGSESREYMRPNFFANTPDIAPEFLQIGGRAAFQIRLVLAATLAGSYGIYGPIYELCLGDAIPGGEEYLDSEKYQLRHFDLEKAGNIVDFIRRVNQIRSEHRALRRGSLRFVPIDNDEMIAYLRSDDASGEVLLVVVALSPHYRSSGWVELPLEDLGADPGLPYQMHDLLGGGRFLWSGSRNYVEIDPAAIPAHVFRLRRRLRTERDFDYYL